MDNKRLIIILSIFTVVFTLMGGTLAYYNWESASNKKTNVIFTVARDYTCGADSGGNITSSDIRLAPAKCTDNTYAIRKTITTIVSVTGDKVVSMDLWLNINSIDTNLANSANFKWVFSRNKNSCESGIISQGTFQNIQNNKIDLLDDVEYATLNDKYYLYIWLDEAETNTNMMNQSFDFSIGGYCVDNGLEKATLKSLDTTAYFRESDYKTAITDIYFIYDTDLPNGITTNNVKTYDLGASATKPITGYLIENTDQGADPDTYKVYISSEYKIYSGILENAFKDMSALKNISFDNLDTSYTANMGSGSTGMFEGCSSLTSLDLSGFNTRNVTKMSAMFQDCKGLTDLDLGYFDTPKLTNMTQMFWGCSKLANINLSSFDTSKVTTMSHIFRSCSNLTELDLSNFNTPALTNTYYMFNGCSKLTTIYVSDLWNMSGITTGGRMFTGSTKLPNYDSSSIDYTKAYYGGDGLGYLTYKPHT